MRRPTPFRRIMSPTERDAIRQEIRDAEQQLRSPDLVDMRSGGGVWAANPQESAAHAGVASEKLSRLKKRLDEEERVIHDQKKKLSRIKELEEWLSKRMVPRNFFHAKREDTKDYNKTVDHLVKEEFSPEFQGKAMELQNLYRARSAMDSKLTGSKENPESASLEHLRQ